ncbi:helix-turn-helix domain-containing protein, partial [Enterococcus sp. 7E2_DIV0204]
VINQREVFLTKKESDLFSFLYKNKNNTVFYDKITSAIWPQNNKIKNYIIANLVFHLREKIKESRELELVTVRGRGYMLRDK